MGVSALNIAIENAFDTAWGSTTPIRFDNVDFEVPVGSWVSIEVWPGPLEKASLGAGVQLRRMVGTVFIMIFTPVSNGVKPAALLADSVVAIFRDLVVSGITFHEGSVSRISEKYYTNSGTGVPATSQQYQMAVAIPFKYDEFV